MKIAHERQQRNAMLESNIMLHNLMRIICLTDQPTMRNLALDVVLWVFIIRLGRYRSPKSQQTKSTLADTATEMPQQQRDCVKILQTHLLDLFRCCYLNGNRTTASKLTKIVLVTDE